MNREQPPITIEVQPVGEHFPVWLKDALLAREGHALLVLYPNEEARSQALRLPLLYVSTYIFLFNASQLV